MAPVNSKDLAASALLTPASMAQGTVAETRPRAGERLRGFKIALYVFVLSRLLIFMAAAIAFGYREHHADPQRPTETIRVFTRAFFDYATHVALQGDAGWYLRIAEQGYEKRPFDTSTQASWAFFPLHPKLWRGLIALGLAPWLAGMLLANVLFVAALTQIWRWMRLAVDEDAALRAVLCIALWPTSYFFSLPFTESLYLFLLASSLLAMQAQRWSWAALFAALCSGTRVVGVLLAPVLWWQARRQTSLLKRSALALAATLGLAVFMWILWRKTGDPLAFVHIQATWGRKGGNLLDPFRRFLADPLLLAEPWNILWLNLASVLLGLGAAGWLLWRRHLALGVFTLLCVLLPWSTGTVTAMARYLSTCAPVFLALACWLKRPHALLVWVLASACLLAGMTAAFTFGESFPSA